MNKSEPIEIVCSDTVKNILFEALKNYTCNSSKDKVDVPLNIEYIKNNLDTNDGTPHLINNTLHDIFYDAINLHYDHLQQKLNTTLNEQRKLMLKMLDGVPTHDEHLESALQKDNLI